MNTPKLAIFDMDGLIFDSERLFMGFLQKAAADLGYEITPEKYALTLGVGVAGTFTGAGAIFPLILAAAGIVASIIGWRSAAGPVWP